MLVLALLLACPPPTAAAPPPEASVQAGPCLATWLRERGSAVAVLDATAFSDLAPVDATSLSIGQQATVGRVTAATRTSLGDRGVVQRLVEADVIKIYAHVQGEICLVAEATADGRYTARFAGEHEYYTNARYVAALSFEVRIDPDGAITAAGVR